MAERDPYPSETQDRFIVRLPDGMRDRIKTKALKNGRSMNSEIIDALEGYFPAPKTMEDFAKELANVMYGLEPKFRKKVLAEMATKELQNEVERWIEGNKAMENEKSPYSVLDDK